tara:strand:+ start:423 stop:665 length:243 start_codon:yes stop_codon:yes gene_type:complete
MNQKIMNQESVNWQKPIRPFHKCRTQNSKTHILNGDGNTTLCGKQIPSVRRGYQVSILDGSFADCKACIRLNHDAAQAAS